MCTKTSSKFNAGISRFKAAAGQKRYFFLVMFAIFATYFVAETRFMSLNFDDTYLLGGHFPAWENLPFFGSGGYALFWQYDMTQNQFRTYGLSRIFFFFFFRKVGADI